MALETFVYNPRRLRNVNEVDDIIGRIKNCENEERQECVVVAIQTTQFGGMYKIKTKKDAEYMAQNPRRCEWVIGCYDEDYFLRLKENFLHPTIKS